MSLAITELLTTVEESTWVCPPNVHSVLVECWGCGGLAGYPGGTGGAHGENGGGGGAWARKLIPTTPGASYNYRVPISGSNDWTYFGSEFQLVDSCYAVMGAGGVDGGLGGLAGDCWGDEAYSGGDGQLYTGSDGGGGGGGAGPSGDGGDASGTAGGSGGDSPDGDGGAGGTVGTPDGGDGTAPGGGGGGSYLGTSDPGIGGRGQIKLTYTPACVQRGGYEIDPSALEGVVLKQRGRYQIDESLGAVMTQRGGYQLATIPSLLVSQRGGYGLQFGTVLVQRGGHQVNSPNLRLTSQRGYYRLGTIITPTVVQKGYHRVFGGFPVEQQGSYRIFNAIGTDSPAGGIQQRGGFRVANDSSEGWAVYVGVDALPDFTQSPTEFSTTLPILVATTPPVSGTRSYYVCVRKRDRFGLESVNEWVDPSTVIVIDSNGDLVLPPFVLPQILQLRLMTSTSVRVLTSYPGFGIDLYPADYWRVWIGTVLPDPDVDTPAYEASITTQNLFTTLESLVPGTYYVMIALVRLSDGLRETLYDTIVVPVPPAQLLAVESGFQVEPNP